MYKCLKDRIFERYNISEMPNQNTERVVMLQFLNEFLREGLVSKIRDFLTGSARGLSTLRSISRYELRRRLIRVGIANDMKDASQIVNELIATKYFDTRGDMESWIEYYFRPVDLEDGSLGYRLHSRVIGENPRRLRSLMSKSKS